MKLLPIEPGKPRAKVELVSGEVERDLVTVPAMRRKTVQSFALRAAI
ncbi:hypothetical protein [Burkholderia cepacia]|nr:hypothetical protein [Burkholderia cepacia]